MMMLVLSTRDCKLGAKHSGDTIEREGKELRTLTFELADLMLDAQELNCLLSEPHAHNSLYNHSADGVRPFLKCFKALELAKGLSGAFVRIEWGVTAFEFIDCTIAKVKLELRDGGYTALSCKVTCIPDLNASLATLVEKMGGGVIAELRGEPPGAQQDLALNSHGTGEQSDTAKPKRRGRHLTIEVN